jgi:hypothetical protein
MKESDQYHEQIAPNLWLMSSHKWAWYGWESSCKKRPAKLVHLDYHWDDLNDFSNPNDVVSLRSITDLEGIEALTIDSDRMLVRQDSFIAPAIIRGLVNQIHFFCLQRDDTPGFDAQFLTNYHAHQFSYSDITDLSNAIQTGPLILDIDLDLFNRATPYFNNKSALLQLIVSVKRIIELAEVITIAKSDLYSWKVADNDQYDWDETSAHYISSLVLPELLKIRKFHQGIEPVPPR